MDKSTGEKDTASSSGHGDVLRRPAVFQFSSLQAEPIHYLDTESFCLGASGYAAVGRRVLIFCGVMGGRPQGMVPSVGGDFGPKGGPTPRR